MKERGKTNKGVSPVIASVLLIVVVIALFVVIFMWVRGSVKDYGTKFNQNVELVCGDVVFDADYSSGVLSLVNDGNIPIDDFNVVEIKSGFKTTISLGDKYSFAGLVAGESKDLNLGTELDDYTKIQVVPVLLADTSTGKNKYSCDDNIKEIDV